LSLPEKAIRYGSAAVLFSFGLYRLALSRHPKWVGMRVGLGDLTLWSFLMASGLMLAPILIGWPQSESGAHAQSASHAGHLQTLAYSNPLWRLAAVATHSAGYLLVAALIAVVVYEKFGLALLSRAWFNLDLPWMIALMISAALILLI